MSVTVLSHRFILQTVSMACRIHFDHVRIHKKYAFIHIPSRNPPTQKMNPPHQWWRIHIRQWRIHQGIMNPTTTYMNPPYVAAFFLPDSLMKAPYSCFLNESAILLNESVPFLTQSGTLITNPALFSGKTVGYLF